MKRILYYPITEKESGNTVEAFLKSNGYSRHIIIHLRRTERGITINGETVYTNHLLKTGETLSVLILENTSSETIIPVSMKLSIVFEDADFMVIDKPCDLPVHPSQGHFENTLANGVAAYFQEKGEPFIYRAVNRLDRDTTGLLIIAKHMLSAALLSSMVEKKKIHREYLAVVSGRTKTSGTICRPIARVDGSTIERCVDDERGEYACTHYRHLFYDHNSDCSLISLVLETGRTHQIRVHMKSIGHPLHGDFLYNPDYRHIARQSLHSYRLAFCHPITGEYLEFNAPIPKDFYFLKSFENDTYKNL